MLRELGVTSSYEDFRALPLGVLEDVRLLMEAMGERSQRTAAAGRRR